MKYQEVTVIDSPITTRYVVPGSKGYIDHNPKLPQIRVGGFWFSYNPKRWKVVTEEEKEKKLLFDLKEAANGISVIIDKEFVRLTEAYHVTEELAMEWMVKDKAFHRRTDGWYIKD